MGALDVLTLVGAAVTAIANLVAQGVSRDDALRRIRSIEHDAQVIDRDVDATLDGPGAGGTSDAR